MGTTANGDKLALKLAPAIGTTYTIRATCAAIARNAATHHRLQEEQCSDESRYLRAVAQEPRVEARIERLVESLPDTDDGPWGVRFGGDPRGCTVQLTAPEPWHGLYDAWAHDGICVEIGA